MTRVHTSHPPHTENLPLFTYVAQVKGITFSMNSQHSSAGATATAPTTSQSSASRRCIFLENLVFPSNKEGGKNWLDIAIAARRMRVAFQLTPGEREINRVSRSGRQLSEIEILQEKHEPEFKQIVPAIAEAITAVLNLHASSNPSGQVDERFAPFETSQVPNILIEDYVHRIAEYTFISPSSMLSALILLDRLSARFSTLVFSRINIFKLFFVAVRVASKVVDLRTLNNKNFSSVGGVSNRQLNDLEARFLIDLKFDLLISPGEFFQYAQRLMNPPAHSSIARPIQSNARGRAGFAGQLSAAITQDQQLSALAKEEPKSSVRTQ